MKEGKMERATYIARISEARAGLQGLLRDCELPQIEAMLRNWGPMGDAGMAMWRQMFEKITDPGSR
jgi:hypothetical protein